MERGHGAGRRLRTDGRADGGPLDRRGAAPTDAGADAADAGGAEGGGDEVVVGRPDAGGGDQLEVQPRPMAVMRPDPGTVIGAPQPADDPPLLGEVRLFAGWFAPSGWMPCDGRLLAIADHEALYALIGIQFGGLGVTTFALPDLRGRVAIGASDQLRPGTRGGDDAVTTVEVAAGADATAAAAGSNRQPQLGLQYLIAVAGVVPAWPV